MYILVQQLLGGIEQNVLICEKKKPIIEYLKKRKCKLDYSEYGTDYYWNWKTDDSKDYYIEKIKQIKL